MPQTLPSGVLRELFERLDTGVLVANDSATYVDVNRAACRLLGRERAQIVGHSLVEFVQPSRIADIALQWQAFLRDGFQSGVFAVTLGNGSQRLLGFHAEANVSQGLHCSFLHELPPDVDPAADSPADMVTLCAWTKRVRVGSEWMSIEKYLQKMFGVQVTHGICPEAYGELGV